MSNDILTGSVTRYQEICNETPFTLCYDSIEFKGEAILDFNPRVISIHAREEITKAMNRAYQLGWEKDRFTWK